MNLFDAIYKELPDFSGLCVRESEADISQVKDIGVTMAWRMNKNRAANMKKILVIDQHRNYFVADLINVFTIAEYVKRDDSKEAVAFQESIYGNWITDRTSGKINDNALEDRCAVIFKNPSEINKIKASFIFSRTSIYYVYKKDKIEQDFLGEYIEIENFGKLEKATININGLTVIAGSNDTGKSTIGKILFSLIKGVSRSKQDLKESREHRVIELIERLYSGLRRTTLNFNLLRETFHPNSFWGNLKTSIIDEITPKIAVEIVAIIDYKKRLLKENLENLQNLENAITQLDKIQDDFIKSEDKETQLARALNKVLFSEFISDISPKGNLKKSAIKYFAGKNELINVEIEKNQVRKVGFFDSLTYQDVIFIETPLILQLIELIQNADVIFEDTRQEFIGRTRSKVALHIKDLVNKILESRHFSETLFYESDFDSMNIIKIISSIIGGGYSFNRDTNELEFINTKKQKIKAVNTASGIKSFGLLQLLLQADVINTKSLLIIDEPENHLHPEWQLKYAETIVELIKAEIPVILTSHSPYMIKALQHFCEKENIQQRASFYFAEKNENSQQVIINDVSDNLNIIFTSLAKPFSELVWK